MNVKSTLWALAFACAAVSCSDDIDAPANENQVNGGNEPSAKMLVTINTGVTTKAGEGYSAEDGNGFEVGSEAESRVKDLTVFLYEIGTDVQDKTALNPATTIAATGYSTVENTTSSSHPDNHGWQAEVQISFTDAADFAGKEYGVLAVTNLGSDRSTALTSGQSKVSTIGELADYVQDAWQTEGVGFVMSTHMMYDGTHYSIVEFPASTDAQDIPEVEVFVERLAAKVRINQGNGYTYTVGEDQVTLNNAVVVNQLSSGSYLLKRVNTVTETELADELNSTDATGDVLLGDEMYANEKANWVIDPWTRLKTDVTSLPTDLAYDNYIIQKDDNDEKLGNAELWKKLTDSKELTDTEDPIHLAYIRENTMKTSQQLNGFSTGVMFKATYSPKNVSVIAEDGKSVASDGTLAAGVSTFYTYGLNQAKFDSKEAILAYVLAGQVSESEDISKVTDYLFYDSFKESTTTTWAQFKASKTYTENRVNDPFGYIQSLRTTAETATDTETITSFATFIASDDFTLPESVKEYKDGECYYFYWIRHENNNLYNKVGPMEFAIVRNNIYDLTVTGISGLGEAGADVPNEAVLDEDETAKMTVTVKVKNWVIRENNSIIL